MITNWMKFDKIFNAGQRTMSSQKLVLSAQIVGFVVASHDSLQITFFFFFLTSVFQEFSSFVWYDRRILVNGI